MFVDHMGSAVLEHVDHMNCRTQVVMDDLWQCMASAHTRCQDMVSYGPARYCVHKDHVGFGVRGERRVIDTLE